MSYAGNIQDDNKSEHKVVEEEKKKDGQDGNKNNSNNSNMAGGVQLPFNLDLTHVLTTVCGFAKNSNPVKAIKEFGITNF